MRTASSRCFTTTASASYSWATPARPAKPAYSHTESTSAPTCDVLKVGHHGSAYASTPEFIAAVHPHAAIISVGRHNTFGLPAPSTLKTLALAGAQIYRTDRCGAATFTANQDLTTMLYCKP
jgi:beta-lactamase superfamily II metal-dependent hydrolase